jgi:hypothetical protein
MELINRKNAETYITQRTMHQQQSNFLILVLYDFIVQNIYKSL